MVKISEPDPFIEIDSSGNRFGGDDKDRTCDLLHAMQTLSQLSYTP